MSYNNPFNPLGQAGSPAVYQALISAIRQIFRWLSRGEGNQQVNEAKSEAPKQPHGQPNSSCHNPGL